jgi:hypothetical protein
VTWCAQRRVRVVDRRRECQRAHEAVVVCGNVRVVCACALVHASGDMCTHVCRASCLRRHRLRICRRRHRSPHSHHCRLMCRHHPHMYVHVVVCSHSHTQIHPYSQHQGRRSQPSSHPPRGTACSCARRPAATVRVVCLSGICFVTRAPDESGIMARFTKPLASHGVSIFKVTTVSNDYRCAYVCTVFDAVSVIDVVWRLRAV